VVLAITQTGVPRVQSNPDIFGRVQRELGATDEVDGQVIRCSYQTIPQPYKYSPHNRDDGNMGVTNVYANTIDYRILTNDRNDRCDTEGIMESKLLHMRNIPQKLLSYCVSQSACAPLSSFLGREYVHRVRCSANGCGWLVLDGAYVGEGWIW
jgi:hypothetical protein